MTIASLLFALIVTAAADQSNGEPVLLDFHASWCGPCQKMRPEIDRLTRKGYPVESIDFDHSRDLVERYKVTAVPTFIVVDAQGRVLARTQGYQPATNLATLYNDATGKLAAQQTVQPTSTPVADDADESEPPPVEKTRPVNPLPWETVVRIKMHLSSKEWGFGSGTIIYSDANESIILTCAHIFRDAQQRAPALKDFHTPISVDLFDGQIPNPKKPMLRCIEKDIVGQAIDYDFTNDVGLIRIRPGRVLPSSRVVPATWKPQRGMKMYSVGCSHGQDATAWDTRILDPKVSMTNGNQSFFEMKCQNQPAEGRSGGGLYTTDGYVAGVCDFADPNEQVGLYAVPTAIHRLLDRNRLMALYKAPNDGSNRMLASAKANQTKVRAQSQDEPDLIPTNGRNLTIPGPNRFNIPTPETRVASTTTRPKVWENSVADASPPPSRRNQRPDRDAGEAIDPGPPPGTALPVDLAMEPSSESAILDMPEPRTIAQKADADSPVRRSSNDRWKSVHSGRRDAETPK